MPSRPPRICSYPGCTETTLNGRCEIHFRKARSETRRESRSKRGYDRRWYRFRLWFLAQHSVCEDCGELASEIHHVEPIRQRPELRLVESNCVSLCKRCHAKRESRVRSL